VDERQEKEIQKKERQEKERQEKERQEKERQEKKYENVRVSEPMYPPLLWSLSIKRNHKIIKTYTIYLFVHT
jgi:hypothetical protein